MSIKRLIKDIPTDLTERRIAVVGALRRHGLSLRKVGLRIGVSASAMSNALMMPSVRAEEALAAALGVPLPELFPERYDRAGNRLCQTKQRKPTTPANPCNVDHEEAA